MPQLYSVILVYSTSHAMHLEKIAAQAGIACRLIPVPRHLSSDCGVCVRIARDHSARMQEIIAASRIGIVGIREI